MDFTESLKVKLSDVPKPPRVPIGHYVMKVAKAAVFSKRGANEEWSVIDIPFRGVEAGEDVDTDDLEEYGSVSSIYMSKGFLFSNNDDVDAQTGNAKTLDAVKRFILDTLKVDAADMELDEALVEIVGAECLVQVIHKANENDPENPHVNIGKTAPIDV